MSEWIRCDEKLPEFGVPVLIWALPQYGGSNYQVWHASLDRPWPSDAKPGLGWTGATSSGYECEDDFDEEAVTHWMPLPEGPNE